MITVEYQAARAGQDTWRHPTFAAADTVKPEIFACPSFWRLELWNYFGALNFGVLLAELLIIQYYLVNNEYSWVKITGHDSWPAIFANLLCRAIREIWHVKISAFYSNDNETFWKHTTVRGQYRFECAYVTQVTELITMPLSKKYKKNTQPSRERISIVIDDVTFW